MLIMFVLEKREESWLPALSYQLWVQHKTTSHRCLLEYSFDLFQRMLFREGPKGEFCGGISQNLNTTSKKRTQRYAYWVYA